MDKNDGKNLRLEQAFDNPVYDIINKAIMATSQKYNYGKYDIAKLVFAIYDNDYGYLTADDDYREQVKMIDEYFQKEFGYRLITFEIIKAIKAFKGTDIYDILTSDIASIEATIKKGKEVPAEDLCVFSKPLDNNRYSELMEKIENEKSFRYAVALIYDKIKNSKQ